MGTFIVIGILGIVVLLAVVSMIKHFKGEGGCCGGGGSTIRENKKLTEPVIGEKIVSIEGMHCENCVNRIERAINKMDGVACKVNLKKNEATITFSKPIEDAAIKEIMEDLDFVVTHIR